MNSTASEETLPSTVDGLIEFAGAVLRTHWAMFLALSVLIFGAELAVGYLMPAKGDTQEQMRDVVFDFVQLLVQSLAIGVVAIAAHLRATGAHATDSTALGLALQRWPAVFGASIIAEVFVILVFAPAPENLVDPSMPLLSLVTAPILCVLVGAAAFAGPVAAMSGERVIVSVFTGALRGLMLGIMPRNLGRTVYIGVLTFAPSVLAWYLTDALHAHHFERAEFWAYAPLDALTIVPLAALQAAFVLDYIRRAAAPTPPR